MDVHLAVASKRDVRRYAAAPLPDGSAERILDAGRLAGTASNRQPVRMLVLHGAVREAAARTVYLPSNVSTSALAVALAVTPGGGLVDFDTGRVAQNMMLAGWADGVGSCPNGVAHPEALATILGLGPQERVPVVLSFGVPADGRDPGRRSAQEWSRRARRLPLEEVVRHLGEDE